MSLDLDEFRAALRAWLPANLDRRGRAVGDPYAPEHVAEHRLIQRRLWDGGYAGLSWPQDFGGGGLSREHEQVFAAEAKEFVTPDFGVLGVTTFGSCVPTMIRHATPEFLARHVPAVLRGEELWCQFFSEPAAGSDLAGVQTRAERTEDGEWSLSGAKVWSSAAHLADWAMCLARTDADVPKHKGLTWFAVPTDAPGLTVRPIRMSSGERDFCEEFLDGVPVPDEDRIGPVDGGWAITSTLLVYERGAGRPAVDEHPDDPGRLDDELVDLARRQGRAGETAVQDLIVSVHLQRFVNAQVKARAATRTRLGTMTAGMASFAKLTEAGLAPARSRALMEIGGAASVAWSRGDGDAAAAANTFLVSKRLAVAGGTEQMQRNAISERVLGLPRERSVDSDVPFREVQRRARDWTP
ncbi:acyl-CoA dehydrogenase family protein [Pseudonocardia xishanensis]|uniref:Acyl-CoA dehydrogenase family protein n=1 Tax=Pseudonocardia xishanensis TaxID=630995 RepID=A0ABP8RU25_9PSEU